MKPIKCWIAEDGDGKVYAYGRKPKVNPKVKSYYRCYDAGIFGDLLTTFSGIQDKSPIRCIIITEEEYRRLKELEK